MPAQRSPSGTATGGGSLGMASDGGVDSAGGSEEVSLALRAPSDAGVETVSVEVEGVDLSEQAMTRQPSPINACTDMRKLVLMLGP